MTIDDIIAIDKGLTDEGQALMVSKNQDYAGGDPDPLRNFRQFGPVGILVRLSDKLARLRTFVERGTFAVKSESVRDTVLDARNYLTLFLAILPKADEDPPDPRAWHNVDQITGQPTGSPCMCQMCKE